MATDSKGKSEILKSFSHLLNFHKLCRCDTITDPLKKIELFKALASPAFIGKYYIIF